MGVHSIERSLCVNPFLAFASDLDDAEENSLACVSRIISNHIDRDAGISETAASLESSHIALDAGISEAAASSELAGYGFVVFFALEDVSKGARYENHSLLDTVRTGADRWAGEDSAEVKIWVFSSGPITKAVRAHCSSARGVFQSSLSWPLRRSQTLISSHRVWPGIGLMIVYPFW